MFFAETEEIGPEWTEPFSLLRILFSYKALIIDQSDENSCRFSENAVFSLTLHRYFCMIEREYFSDVLKSPRVFELFL